MAWYLVKCKDNFIFPIYFFRPAQLVRKFDITSSKQVTWPDKEICCYSDMYRFTKSDVTGPFTLRTVHQNTVKSGDQGRLWISGLTLVTGSNCLFVCLSASLLQLCCQARWEHTSGRAVTMRWSPSSVPTAPASRCRWRSTASLRPPKQCVLTTPRRPDCTNCHPTSPASGPTLSRSVRPCLVQILIGALVQRWHTS